MPPSSEGNIASPQGGVAFPRFWSKGNKCLPRCFSGKVTTHSQHPQGIGEELGSNPCYSIFGDTNEAFGSGGSHERISESDGISPTIAGRVTCAIIHKSDSPPDLLSGTWNGLLQLEHRKCKYKQYVPCLAACGQGSSQAGWACRARKDTQSATCSKSQGLSTGRREKRPDRFSFQSQG